MGDVNLEIKLNNIDERVIKIEESGGSGGDGYITSVSNDFNVVNKKLSLSNDVTTKLSKVDTTDNLSVELAKKINKPVSATNGQVLTYNGTSNEWEAQDSKGGSITEPTDLEKGIIGGDEWVSGGSYTIGESVVIDENKLYLLVGDGGSTTKPSTDTTHSIWEETSISTLNSKLKDIVKVDSFTPTFRDTTQDFLYNAPTGYVPIKMLATLGYDIRFRGSSNMMTANLYIGGVFDTINTDIALTPSNLIIKVILVKIKLV